MKPSPSPDPAESTRLESLRSLHLLDTPPDTRFDAITTLATLLFDVPIAVVTLVDMDRQWFKSSHGLGVSETPRDIAFCAHTIRSDDVFLVGDATADARFAKNPLVVGHPHIRFYAGLPVHAPDGQPVGALAVIDRKPRALTAREREVLRHLVRMAEFEMQAWQAEHARDAAEKELRLKSREVELQASALQAAAVRKNEFLATLAHELRNPLAPICSAAELIQRRQPVDPIVRQAQIIIQRQSGHLAKLVDDLMDINRISYGRLAIERRPVPAATIVNDAVDAIRPSAVAASHALNVMAVDERLHVNVDAVRATQALTNLLTNAVKYTPPSGCIDVSVAADDAMVSIRVRDNGLGIEADALERIFDPFAQDKRLLPHRQGGLGIGLSLARQLAELHGGNLVCTSEGLGRGSTFVLSLPRVAPASTTAGAGEKQEALVPLEILIVDDNRDALATLRQLLELDGHSVTVADNGREAIAAIRRDSVDVVLLDLGLPDLDGCEVASAIRMTAPSAASPLLVALTGWGQEEDRRRTATAGFDHHLTKPVDYERLQRLLQPVVPRSR